MNLLRSSRYEKVMRGFPFLRGRFQAKKLKKKKLIRNHKIHSQNQV